MFGDLMTSLPLVQLCGFVHHVASLTLAHGQELVKVGRAGGGAAVQIPKYGGDEVRLTDVVMNAF